MKKLLIPALMGLAALVSLPSYAQVTDTFTVTVNLTSACRLSTAPGDLTLNYVSYGAAQTATTPFGVECTNTLPYSMGISAGSNADTLGLLVPLAIRNSGNTADVTGTQTAGAAAASYLIRADIAAGQQGTCATATCNSVVTRTLTITY